MLHARHGKFNLHLQSLAWMGLAGLLFYQAWLFYFRLQLSLGPRVIFEPWALRNGFVLYENLVDIHSPLMPWLLAVLGWLIPNGLYLAKVVLIGLLSLSTLLTFFTARRSSGNWAGLAAAALFVLWAPTFGAGKLWYESFLMPAYLVYLIGFGPSDQPRSPRWWFAWGIFGGITVLIKQHAALVFAVFLLWEALTAASLKRPWRYILRDVSFTGLISFVPVILALTFQWAQAGNVNSLIYWLVEYPLNGVYQELAASPPNESQLKFLLEIILLLVPAVIWLGVLIRRKDAAWRQVGLWLCIILAGGFTAYPRFSAYHLQPIMPVIAIFSVWITTIALRARVGKFTRIAFIGIILTISCLWLQYFGSYQVYTIRNTQPRYIAEYSKMEVLAAQIRQITGTPESLYIIVDDESTSNLYYLLDCPPPGYWIFHYSWYMLNDVKTNILATLEESPPEWVVYLPEKWQVDSYAPELLDYIETNYQVEAELTLDTTTVYLMRRLPGQ
jgi:hypothetical protein